MTPKTLLAIRAVYEICRIDNVKFNCRHIKGTK